MSNHDAFDDKLNLLKQTAMPSPSEAARQRALDAALLAFDAEQHAARVAAQGNPLIQRLRSMFATAKGNWTMDTRLTYGLGTAAIALLLLPLGYQLYTSTAISPIGVPPMVRDAVIPMVTPDDVAAPGRVAVEEQEAVTANEMAASGTPAGELSTVVADEAAPAAPVTVNRGVAQPKLGLSAGIQSQDGMMAEYAPMPEAVGMPAPVDAMVAPTDPSGDEFAKFTESPLKIVRTFSGERPDFD